MGEMDSVGRANPRQQVENQKRYERETERYSILLQEKNIPKANIRLTRRKDFSLEKDIVIFLFMSWYHPHLLCECLFYSGLW